MLRVAGSLGRIFQRVHLPAKAAYLVVKGLRILVHPVNYGRRRRGARAIIDRSEWAAYIDSEKGYARFSSGTFPGTERVLAICGEIYVRHRMRNREAAQGPVKPFLFNILDERSLDDNAELLDFALSAPVVEAVTGYLGAVPMLRGLGVFLSPSNESIESSQMFHTDNDDFHQIKCFMNVVDVDEGGGPFTFVPADKSKKIRAKLGHGWRDRRLTDEEVLGLCQPDDVVKLAGPAGSGGMVDTSNCLHYGSRARTGERLVFMFQYTTYPNVAVDNLSRSGRNGLPLYRFPVARVGSDPLKKALLGPGIGRDVISCSATG